MKKNLFIASMMLVALCFAACSQTNNPTEPETPDTPTITPPLEESDYVDLGLPNHIKWGKRNEDMGDWNYAYKKSIPTRDDFIDLLNNCKWEWGGTGFTITGPNGNSIWLPTEGSTSAVKSGYYWIAGEGKPAYFYFNSKLEYRFESSSSYSSWINSVRLVER